MASRAVPGAQLGRPRQSRDIGHPWRIWGLRGPWRGAPPLLFLGTLQSSGNSESVDSMGSRTGADSWGRSGSVDSWGRSGRETFQKRETKMEGKGAEVTVLWLAVLSQHSGSRERGVSQNRRLYFPTVYTENVRTHRITFKSQQETWGRTLYK